MDQDRPGEYFTPEDDCTDIDDKENAASANFAAKTNKFQKPKYRQQKSSRPQRDRGGKSEKHALSDYVCQEEKCSRKLKRGMIDSLRKQGFLLSTAICRDCFGKMLKFGHIGLKNKQKRHKVDRKPQAARRAGEVSKVYRATAQPPTTKPSTLASVGAYLSGGCGWGTDEDTAMANFAEGTTGTGCSTTSSAAYPELDSDSDSESGVSWADWEASSGRHPTTATRLTKRLSCSTYDMKRPT